MLHKILVVDDEEAVRETIRYQLSGTRYEVIEAQDGEQGINLLNSEDNHLTVDVIICDIRMPKIDGIDAIAYFRKEYPSIPVIVLTGYPDVKLAVGLMKQGIVEHLVKPVAKERLIKEVEKASRERAFFTGAKIQT